MTNPKPGKFFRIVGRPEQTRLARQIVVNLALIEDVIAGSENVDAEAKQLFGDQGRDAEAAG